MAGNTVFSLFPDIIFMLSPSCMQIQEVCLVNAGKNRKFSNPLRGTEGKKDEKKKKESSLPSMSNSLPPSHYF